MNGKWWHMYSKQNFILSTMFLTLVLSASELPEAQELDNGLMNEFPKNKVIKRAPASNVLSFEADMVEGEKRRPDLFLQTDVEELSLDNILYIRRDFNDFHSIDSKRRPRHFRFRAKK